MLKLRTIEKIRDIKDKRVLVRLDADVPLSEGRVSQQSDYRLRNALPTLNYLREEGAKIVLMGHIDRPDGEVVEELRIKPVAEYLEQLLGTPVIHMDKITGTEVADAAYGLRNGELLFLENLRFDKRETENDPDFARELSALGDLYVNESFATAHRKHASVVGVAEYIPSYAGLNFAKEVKNLSGVFDNAARPLAVIISGVKIGTKVKLLENILPKVDYLLVGGGIANMFLQSTGKEIGDSINEPELASKSEELWREYSAKIIIPTDVKVKRKDGGVAVLDVDNVSSGDAIFDLGPMTIQKYCNIVSDARTCVWNGPLGKVEEEDFQEATREFAECLGSAEAFSVVGGGDTITALMAMELLDGFDHVCAGGGAMIAFLEGKELPAVKALML